MWFLFISNCLTCFHRFVLPTLRQTSHRPSTAPSPASSRWHPSKSVLILNYDLQLAALRCIISYYYCYHPVQLLFIFFFRGALSQSVLFICCASVFLVKASCRATLMEQSCVTSLMATAQEILRYRPSLPSLLSIISHFHVLSHMSSNETHSGEAFGAPVPSLRSGLGGKQHHGGRLRQEGGGVWQRGPRSADLRLHPRPDGEGVDRGCHQPQWAVGCVWQLRPVSTWFLCWECF